MIGEINHPGFGLQGTATITDCGSICEGPPQNGPQSTADLLYFYLPFFIVVVQNLILRTHPARFCERVSLSVVR
jgi:hypothetical protein